jgi:predicted lactoylglutathione lyase
MAVPQRLSIVTLGVADLERATAFYESLGWKPTGSMPGIVFFQLSGITLGLYPWEALADDAGVPAAGSGFRGVTLAMNYASTGEVDAVFADWIAAGATSVVEPHTAFWGGYSSYVADLDGHLWEIAHAPNAPLDAEGRLVMGGD